MIFTSAQFVLFAGCFFAVYGILRGRTRKGFLLAASYLFYASWNVKFLGLIVGSTLLDYHVGRALAVEQAPGRRRRLLLLSVCGNLGALALFKYFGFFVDSAVGGLASIGLSVKPLVLDVALPVGISFYTFQTMSYTIDIYRRTRLAPASSLLDFALYVGFFPQLVAGPIERARQLLPQLSCLDRRPISSGWALLAMGAFKKVVIADRMAPLVAAVYAAPHEVHAPAMWLATYAFALQIYFDFSGYSDIAAGLGRLMGIELVQNFRSPYAADSPSDLWKRWHISLSSWLRDYLYIPLGGSRGPRWATCRNLLLTMLLGGLWHGAAWSYVLWGAYHGALLLLFRLPGLERLANRSAPWPLTLLRRLAVFHLVCLGWVLFRAETLADCGALWQRMLSPDALRLSGWLDEVALSGQGRYLAAIFAVVVLVVLLQNLLRSDSQRIADRLWRAPALVRSLALAALLSAAVLLAPESPPPFIYFQF